ncbi:unnamed protein product (macronuclear) [Paramecium tetraurelia]|uniref:Uncharacterized protein n=1 Tax=Paramecium tetraurelia TaxID=5888 RepID=A0DGY2_PARTE|nr:uncharacterized protein GSPATT00002428001 [Paramecium tetraurelia]CAK82299.1 unnamed protein product [Paramecium tetraurelia]|eukprot:XP_001449696.1 hypothetical protein (macronuclear) [Paramecium tetraurelia strain d4-2]
MDSSFYQPYQYKKYTLRNYLLKQDQLDYQYECLELENDQWSSISILKGYPQYIKIRIQDYFPLKIFFNVGAFKCNTYFSFQTFQPSETNHQKHVVIKQQKIIVIKRPEEHKQYLFITLLSDFSTQVKLKAWFQKSEKDRCYFLCYYGQEQNRKRSCSQNNNRTDEESCITVKNNTTTITTTNCIEKSHLSDGNVPPLKSLSENRRFNTLKQKTESIPLKSRILQVQQKKLQLYSQNVVQRYQRMLIQSYKQLNQSRMMKKYIHQWIITINFLQQMELIYAHFKINKILRCMSNSPKLYAQRWKQLNDKNFGQKSKILIQANLTLSIYSNQVNEKIQQQISQLIFICLADTSFIQKQAQLQQSFVNFYLRVRKIQQYYLQQRNKFNIQMNQMIQNIKQHQPTILISKQRMKRILSQFYQLLCANHKSEYKRYMLAQISNTTLLTSVFALFTRPKLNMMKNQALLLQLIEQTK